MIRRSSNPGHQIIVAGIISLALGIWVLFSARSGAGVMMAGQSTAAATPLTGVTQATPTPDSTANPMLPPATTPGSAQSSRVVPGKLFALGNSWVYQAAYYEGNNASDIITTTSIITERVVEIQTGPDYFAARIQQEYSPEISSEYWHVVMGNRIYRQEGHLDLSTVQKKGEVELVFPLKLGDQWYQGEEMEKMYPAHDNGSMLWRVTRVGSVTVPAGSFDNCYFLEEEIGGMTFENWFCPGVGWVDMKADHYGTPFGSRWVLLRFSNPRVLPGGPRETLDQFMQARVNRQDQLILDLLTYELAARTYDGSSDLNLYQVSNPCWYRYLVLQFEQTAATLARARVRVYEHQWGGDIMGTLPQSWEQTIGLVETSFGWRVDQMGPPENRRAEPSEPHGPTLSECNATH